MLNLTPLPYEKNALAPFISEDTLNLHYDKHHMGYLNNLNKLIAGTDFATATLEKIITESHGKSDKVGMFNNAAQVWNHTFYWHSMKQNGGGKPTGALLKKINETWEDFDAFATAFKDAGMTQFGSGWVWLILKDGALSIMKTSNADLPLVHGAVALLTCDVWEHAYYLDYQNRRVDYIGEFLAHLANWDFAAENYESNI
jgi:superoxide dismutase, Fe-Mn family